MERNLVGLSTQLTGTAAYLIGFVYKNLASDEFWLGVKANYKITVKIDWGIEPVGSKIFGPGLGRLKFLDQDPTGSTEEYAECDSNQDT
jgi:hypothetical protein